MRAIGSGARHVDKLLVARISDDFAMAGVAKKVVLRRILDRLEANPGYSVPCRFGSETCDDDYLCAVHCRWKHAEDLYAEFVKATTVFDVRIKRAAC